MTVEQIYTKVQGAGIVRLVTITNSVGMTVEFSSLGAGIVSVVVPDRDGRLADVALGYAETASYLHDGPCAGKVPGRYANRIAGGRFALDGRVYQLALNDGPNALHGGPEGFQNRIWETHLLPNGVRFVYHSKDGEEGYPGNLTVEAVYTMDENDNRLSLTLTARTDDATVINLTNHTYWNLRGEGTGTVLKHRMQMKAARYLPTDEWLIPTGEFLTVHGTPMDFTAEKEIGQDIKADFPAIKFAKGYDSSWVVDGWEPGRYQDDIVTIFDPESGRVLSIGSTQPAAHVYTGNWLEGSPQGKCGRSYHNYEGVAVEMQGFPDAPNHPQFPNPELRPGQRYTQTITFTFSTRQ